MVPYTTRRRLLVASISGGIGLAGCQSMPISNPELSIKLTITNATEENHEVWVQLTSTDDDVDDQLGKRLLLNPQDVENVTVDVPKGTYTLTVSVNDISPTVKRSVRWEITGQQCSTGTMTVNVCDEEPELLVNVQSCDDT